MPFRPLSFCLELILLSKTDNMAGCSLLHPAQAMNSSRGKQTPESGDVLVQWAEMAPASWGHSCRRASVSKRQRRRAFQSRCHQQQCFWVLMFWFFFFPPENSWISSWNTVVFLITIKVVQPAGLEICIVWAQLFLELLSCTSPGIHGDKEIMGTKC